MNLLQIGFLIYPGVIQLDVMGAHQVLSFPPNTQVHVIGETLAPVTRNEGLILVPTVTLADLFTPGRDLCSGVAWGKLK